MERRKEEDERRCKYLRWSAWRERKRKSERERERVRIGKGVRIRGRKKE